jgi:ankyrin repeat protein
MALLYKKNMLGNMPKPEVLPVNVPNQIGLSKLHITILEVQKNNISQSLEKINNLIEEGAEVNASDGKTTVHGVRVQSGHVFSSFDGLECYNGRRNSLESCVINLPIIANNDEKYYFEVTLLTAGDIRIGICTDEFTGDGNIAVGDDRNSWCYAGFQNPKIIHNSIEEKYGSKWRKNDIVGISIHQKIIEFSLNGNSFGNSFTLPTFVNRIYPAISLNYQQSVRFNFGSYKLQYISSSQKSILNLHQDIVMNRYVPIDRATPLHFSTYLGYQDISIKLINSGARIDDYDINGNTIIHHLSVSGNVELLKYLFNVEKRKEYQKMINSPNDQQLTPMNLAARYGHQDCVRVLLDNGASVNGINKNDKIFGVRPLTSALVNGNLECAKVLIDYGAMIQYLESYPSNISPVHITVMNEDLPSLELLIDNDADLNSCNSDMLTPLHLAVMSNNYRIVETLLSSNVNINACNQKNKTPIIMAAELGYSKITDLLINYNANMYRIDNDGKSCLHYLVAHNDIDLMDLINLVISKNGMIDVGKNNWTSIFEVIKSGNVPLLKLFMKNNASLDIVSQKGTPEQYAREINSSTEIINILNKKEIKEEKKEKISPLNLTDYEKKVLAAVVAENDYHACIFPTCSSKAKLKNNLLTHIKKVHKKQGEELTEEGTVKHNIESNQTQPGSAVPPLQCGHTGCGVTFKALKSNGTSNKSSLEKHQKLFKYHEHHFITSRNECSVCQKYLASQAWKLPENESMSESSDASIEKLTRTKKRKATTKLEDKPRKKQKLEDSNEIDTNIFTIPNSNELILMVLEEDFHIHKSKLEGGNSKSYLKTLKKCITNQFQNELSIGDISTESYLLKAKFKLLENSQLKLIDLIQDLKSDVTEKSRPRKTRSSRGKY